MLVRFQTESSFADYLESVSVSLLKMMGASGRIPGAFDKEHVDAHLQNLKCALSAIAAEEQNLDPDSDNVSMNTRAMPLINLMERAVKDGEYLMWDYN